MSRSRLGNPDCAIVIWQSVATISAGNDALVGALIADALDKVGADGVLSIETSNRFAAPVQQQNPACPYKADCPVCMHQIFLL